MSQVQVPQTQIPQIQVQAPVQARDDYVKIEYSTWGSCQIHWKKAVLVDGTVVDPLEVHTSRFKGGRTTVELKIGDVCIEAIAENWSSRKNAHYYVKIPRHVVLAVVYYSTSCRNRYLTVHGEGEVEEKIETREVVNGRYKYITTYDVVYYVNRQKNIRVEVFRFKIDEKKELADKPRLYVKKVNNVLEVSGDTYHVKEKLKELKFRWDPAKKVWYHTDENALLYLTTFAEVNEQ